MYIMAKEPIPDMSPTEVRTYFSGKHSEKDLADAYAVVHNKFWWVEDREYDYEEGTPEHKAACAISDAWCELMEEYKSKILDILQNEGVTIPETRQITVLAPFMARHGYLDGNGWWIKK